MFPRPSAAPFYPSPPILSPLSLIFPRLHPPRDVRTPLKPQVTDGSHACPGPTWPPMTPSTPATPVSRLLSLIFPRSHALHDIRAPLKPLGPSSCLLAIPAPHFSPHPPIKPVMTPPHSPKKTKTK
ncbi:hypothetical protein M422DRAFT_265413 [Sphaerobolus stellatus SS14]|uniref:Uncharacterized protein n=1 Tax=Sphaerobolus stellatus (strain SS14) TaxID=990650 RepID=A0A0C9TRG2_SPHS4|nr:hypothetical protein M422DRAFT_265413 [Sphaerobolus stellatus SS14]